MNHAIPDARYDRGPGAEQFEFECKAPGASRMSVRERQERVASWKGCTESHSIYLLRNASVEDYPKGGVRGTQIFPRNSGTFLLRVAISERSTFRRPPAGRSSACPRYCSPIDGLRTALVRTHAGFAPRGSRPPDARLRTWRPHVRVVPGAPPNQSGSGRLRRSPLLSCLLPSRVRPSLGMHSLDTSARIVVASRMTNLSSSVRAATRIR